MAQCDPPTLLTLSAVARGMGMSRGALQWAYDSGALRPAALTERGTPLFDHESIERLLNSREQRRMLAEFDPDDAFGSAIRR